MNSFQAVTREEVRSDLLRKDTRSSRHQRKPEEDQRPPPEDDELMQIFEEADDPE